MTLRPKVQMIEKSFGSEGWRSSEKVREGWLFLGDVLEMFRRYLAKVGDEDVVKSAPKTWQDSDHSGVESDGSESGFLTDCSVELGSPFHEGAPVV